MPNVDPKEHCLDSTHFICVKHKDKKVCCVCARRTDCGYMNNSLTIWLGATRYYLGRMSYAVSDFTDALKFEWKNLDERTKELIERDVEEAFEQKRTGMDCDTRRWEEIRKLWKNTHE